MTSPSDPAPLAEPARPRSVTPVPLARRTTKPAPPPAGLPPSGPPSPQVAEEPPVADPDAGQAAERATEPPAEPAVETPTVADPGGATPAPVSVAKAPPTEPLRAAAPPTEQLRAAAPYVPAPSTRATLPATAPPASAPPPWPPIAADSKADTEADTTAAAEEAEVNAEPEGETVEAVEAEPAAPEPAAQPDTVPAEAPTRREEAEALAAARHQNGSTANGTSPKSVEVAKLTASLVGLRHTLATSRYTLNLPGAEEAEATRAATVGQLDDYLLPRMRRLDAPLLVVVGGSTGAGKSTLVNSLVRAPVSPAGVLRPTTRAPVLVCHPADLPWFAGSHLLPGMARTSGPSTDPNSLQVVNAAHLSPGLAFLDAPDIDSVVDSNRALATQLLAAADLWLFVTTAARYADAVPWTLLRTAKERGTVVALVLDRVPPGAADEIGPHLTQMLRDNGLGGAPLFVLPEASLDGQGLLAERVITPLRAWFDELANSSQARAAVVRRTVGGAIDALGPVVDRLAAAADEQVAAEKALAGAVQTAYADAENAIENGMRDGVLLRGEVLSRWQELVGTGDLMRALQARVGRARDRVVATVTGKPAPGRQFQAALESGVVTLIRGAAADAAEKATTAWKNHPAGAKLLTPELAKPSPDLDSNAQRLVRDWQRGVLDMVRQEAEGKLKIAKVSAYAVNATGLLVMVSVFAATAFIPTGLEVATAAGTTVAAQKVLEAIFGDQAVRSLAERARADLLTRVQELLNAEAARFDGPRAMTMVDPRTAWRLRDSATDVSAARQAVNLPAGEVPRPGLIKTAGDR
ncbi:GTPase domain-containing protein [Virgisporangium ochraceum]|uniref:Dynamin family protein n=1 Tax=Virgisporangium ochraceum TaxID=65505 RepID=A0A8J3ZLW1_9ACTN|nr:ABC transporter [Virgisporangium ochraceum]GIJ66151.1 hypothetical protein Voc01_010680 [Virgisporangium ochraceum]